MKSLAIIGSGAAGLCCAHFLHSCRRITVYERASQAGGHAASSTAEQGGEERVVDTAFMTYSPDTSPALHRLLRSTGTELHRAPVSYSLRNELTGAVWTGPSARGNFHQPGQLLSLRHWRAALLQNRFGREARAALLRPEIREMTLREYLERAGWGAGFIEHSLLPLSAALRGTTPDLTLELPAETLLRQLELQGFLWGRRSPVWVSVKGGAREYVRRLSEPWRERIRVACPALRVERAGGRVIVHAGDGTAKAYDQVIIATHADQALQLLAQPTAGEQRLLSEFRYQRNLACLHTDVSVLPRNRRTWAGCNLLLSRGAEDRPMPSAHYWMNRLSGLSGETNYIVSLGRPEQIEPRKVIRGIHYETPLLNLWALRAQTELPALNIQAAGGTETYFAGGYFRGDTHEDAVQSALQLCEILLGRSPWDR